MNRKKGHSYSGWLFSFEGVDGSGKSTQAKMARDYLTSRGYNCVMPREPGTTNVGEQIRKILLGKENSGMVGLAELFLFEAARAQIVEEVIIPALKEGKTIIMDRFYDSTIAYQGARGISKKVLSYENNIATGGISTDRTYIFDIDLKTRRNRMGANLDRIEGEGLHFHQAIIDNYREIAKRDSGRVLLVDGTEDVDIVHARVVEDLNKFLEI